MSRLQCRARSLAPVVLTSALLAACGAAGESTGSGGSGGSGGGAGQTGVPCDVAAVLADNCLSCHGATPSTGVPMSLVTYDDLTAQSAVDSAKTVVERAVIRMKSADAPMPPAGGAAAADIAVLEAWISAGTPEGDCQAPQDPFAGPLGCTSGKEWNPGWEEGTQMNPGRACNACHQKSGEEEGPIFDVAGTVYASGRETDYCYGVDGTSPDFQDVVVEITDAKGAVYSLHPNKTGNFWLEKAAFAAPYTARVVSSKGERAMNAAQTIGDCNLCHTPNGGGNGSAAPGRIVIPL